MLSVSINDNAIQEKTLLSLLDWVSFSLFLSHIKWMISKRKIVNTFSIVWQFCKYNFGRNLSLPKKDKNHSHPITKLQSQKPFFKTTVSVMSTTKSWIHCVPNQGLTNHICFGKPKQNVHVSALPNDLTLWPLRLWHQNFAGENHRFWKSLMCNSSIMKSRWKREEKKV